MVLEIKTLLRVGITLTLKSPLPTLQQQKGTLKQRNITIYIDKYCAFFYQSSFLFLYESISLSRVYKGIFFTPSVCIFFPSARDFPATWGNLLQPQNTNVYNLLYWLRRTGVKTALWRKVTYIRLEVADVRYTTYLVENNKNKKLI